MVKFIVIDWSRRSGNPPRGLGEMTFRVAPSRGDIITIDENGVAQAYEVLAVVHPHPPASTAGDLIIRHVGTDLEWRTRLNKEG